ncbi:hypothetical protein POM88_038047 [Heracleum sosnowskyi]|uniref:DUF4408 domain-containing protein n=1 Tax=Heracleum sosnowskyi TaxID=360622 RepID=A0AAD8MDU1_9APIA|nr:hypothetical protein POM88_038047 [Heracleum sosnowskyi]
MTTVLLVDGCHKEAYIGCFDTSCASGTATYSNISSLPLFLLCSLHQHRGKSRLETTVWAIQLLLLLVGFISIVLVFKTAVIPYSFSKVSTLPQLWLSLKFWLSPPYIYVIINIIIVFVVVSSALYHPRVNEDQHSHEYVSPRLRDEDEEAKHISSSPEHIKNILVTEQPVPENSDEDFDSMEATWEAIVEAGKLPEKKQLKKMETWNAPPVVMAAAGKKEMRKLETFNESLLGRQRGGLMKDMSVGQAELNNRIEAFISKFNRDMRLQRQESDQRFLEMINR